ncbi:hypothetical protein NPIL_45351 [Nephila pilipes]|uniref:Uncharacterized protein n=1 Tax=Nephila pilipes TaxID=299642 RepID=A0A8X6P060_NEPPI|nr:hypothetical protein NPIL_45351 [Nephila pilipes]
MSSGGVGSSRTHIHPILEPSSLSRRLPFGESDCVQCWKTCLPARQYNGPCSIFLQSPSVILDFIIRCCPMPLWRESWPTRNSLVPFVA